MYAKRLTAAVAALLLALSIGCSQHRANTPSEKKAVADALTQAGYDKISISEDRDKGVITLKGDIPTQADKEKAVNKMVEDFVRGKPHLKYIETYDLVLGNDGKPRAELFVEDKLHFNAEGYKLLVARVRPFLPK